jgi:predicted double-glycine peptidase
MQLLSKVSFVGALASVLVFYPVSTYSSEFAYISNTHARGSIPITSWKSRRDENIVKQDLDYSCGAASLATIINGYYGQTVTEEDILKLMNKEDMRASFDDMAAALSELGFRGVGYAASFEQLKKLKIPVVVYTKHRKNDHFSVLRGIDNNTVLLADPSLGNRTYSKFQFLEMWETRAESNLKGKILAILPKDKNIDTLNEFFTNKPFRQTSQAVLHSVIRSYP